MVEPTEQQVGRVIIRLMLTKGYSFYHLILVPLSKIEALRFSFHIPSESLKNVVK